MMRDGGRWWKMREMRNEVLPLIIHVLRVQAREKKIGHEPTLLCGVLCILLVLFVIDL